MKKARHALKTKGTMHKLRNVKNLGMLPPPKWPNSPNCAKYIYFWVLTLPHHRNRRYVIYEWHTRIIFEKFTAATAFKGAVFSETKVCMASILYSKPGDNGTWIIFEPAYGFGAWVSFLVLNYYRLVFWRVLLAEILYLYTLSAMNLKHYYFKNYL